MVKVMISTLINFKIWEESLGGKLLSKCKLLWKISVNSIWNRAISTCFSLPIKNKGVPIVQRKWRYHSVICGARNTRFPKLHLHFGPKKTNSVALIPQAKYTDWTTATCRRNLVPTFADRGASRGQRGGSRTVVNLSVLDRSRYFSFNQLLI
jgi:hypothetical protein